MGQRHHAVLIVFQAMDVAGKDSTIGTSCRRSTARAGGWRPSKQRSSEELDHIFL